LRRLRRYNQKKKNSYNNNYVFNEQAYEYFIEGIVNLIFSLIFLIVNISRILINSRKVKIVFQQSFTSDRIMIIIENIIYFVYILTIFILYAAYYYFTANMVLLFNVIIILQ
jgi:hypothetical protein